MKDFTLNGVDEGETLPPLPPPLDEARNQQQKKQHESSLTNSEVSFHIHGGRDGGWGL